MIDPAVIVGVGFAAITVVLVGAQLQADRAKAAAVRRFRDEQVRRRSGKQ